MIRFSTGGSFSRSGLTLLEVLIALSIFVAAFAAISQLFTLGSRAAIQASLETQAVLRCESKLAEVVAGIESLEAADGTAYEDDPRWVWSLAVDAPPDSAPAELMQVTVTVAFVPEDENEEMEFSLVRFLRDPQVLVDAAEAAAEAEAEAEGGAP